MENTSAIPGKFLDPKSIINQLDVQSGAKVADFGCASGYFSLPFAQAIGEEGELYALDVLPQALETVAGKARLAGLTNIVTKRVNFENERGTKLEDNMLDWVVLKDVLFQNQKKDQILKEAYRVLKQGGALVVVEWNTHDYSVGPEKELRISPENMERMLNAQNFIVKKEIEAGTFHYAKLAVK